MIKLNNVLQFKKRKKKRKKRIFCFTLGPKSGTTFFKPKTKTTMY